MKKIFLSLVNLLLFSLPIIAQNQMTASQVLDKIVNLIKGSKGCEAQFKIFNSGYSGSGNILTSGNKFKVTLPDVQVWYNGKELYTLNKRTSETTVVIPTAEELAESNPLSYVAGAKQNYDVKFSTVKKPHKYVLELTPKRSSGTIKRVTLTVNSTDFAPEKIVVEPNSGNPISADILGFKRGVASSSSEFEYPKSQFPKIELIDLR